MSIKIDNSSLLFLTVAGLVLGLFSHTQAWAQLQHKNEIPESNITVPVQSDSLTVSYKFEDLQGLAGGQFRIHYDPSKLKVEDLSGCLSGLPATHDGSFSECNDVKDRAFVQFIILDLGKNRPVGTEILGSIKFTTIDGAGSLEGDEISIKDIKLAGPDGKYLETNRPVSEGLTVQVNSQ